MKFSLVSLASFSALMGGNIAFAQTTMVKMCLFYENPSGHARSDPILNNECASGHVHTFYGPQNFHPNTRYEDLRDTPARFSSSSFVENQSLYWHPSIYEVSNANGGGTQTYTRVNNLATHAYYRWDNTVFPRTETFPPGFRMIAYSNDFGADRGELGNDSNLFTECCNFDQFGRETCSSWDGLFFPPDRTCDDLGVAFAMPTCWDGQSIGDENDHKSHMAYTTNGRVDGPCPSGFGRRLPQVQLFVRVTNYDSRFKSYQLSDGQGDIYHVDYFNGWQEGKLQDILDNCMPVDESDYDYGYNPPCGCTPGSEANPSSSFLSNNTMASGPVCDIDVQRLIIDESTDSTETLPSGSCTGRLIPRSWDALTDNVFECVSDEGDDEDDDENDEDDDENDDEDENMGDDSDELEGQGGRRRCFEECRSGLRSRRNCMISCAKRRRIN